MKTIIMAGGRGTRIQSVASDIPKPMIKIGGIPILEREIRSLSKQGFRDIIITISHLGHIIENYFGDGANFNVHIEYFHEEHPMGNAGALFKLKNKLKEPFLLLNGDLVFDVDFNRMIEFHKKSKALATIYTHPNDHPYDSGLIITDNDKTVKQWLTKEDERPKFYKNRVNAGLHIIDPSLLDMVDIDIDKIGTLDNDRITQVDLDRQLLRPLAGTKKIACYDSPEYVKDMGTPERLRQVEKDFKSGKVESKNLLKKQKAIFLDRDGVINIYKGFIRNIEDFELVPNIAEVIKKINESNYLCIVITNQPVIARGEMTFEQLETIHNKMETLLGQNGAYLDGIYFCPHHPDGGYDGEVPELKKDCSCRKPKPGLLLKAAKDFNIDLSQSWMFGDSDRDVEAGLSAGCQAVLVKQNDTNDLKRNLVKLV